MILGAATVGILVVQLAPWGDPRRSTACLVCGPHPTVSAVINLLMFSVVGGALALLGLSRRRAVVVGALFALVFELLQLVLPVGRIASLTDLSMSAAGVVLGFAAMTNRRSIFYPRSKRSLALAAGTAAAWLLFLAITTWALRPAIPDPPIVGQWSPRVAGFEQHSGRVLDARVAAVPLPPGPVGNASEMHDALGKSFRLDVTAEPGTVTRGIAPIVRAVGENGREFMLLARRGADLIFRASTHGQSLGLLSPAVVLVDAFAEVDRGVAQPAVFSGEHALGELRLGAYGRSASSILHPGAGWMLFVPTAGAPLPGDAISAIWVGMPLFLVGYWTGRRARRRARRAGDVYRMTGTAGELLRAIPVLAALVIVGLGGLASLFDLSVPPWEVWAGAAGGASIGLGVGIIGALAHSERSSRKPTTDHVAGVELSRTAATGS